MRLLLILSALIGFIYFFNSGAIAEDLFSNYMRGLYYESNEDYENAYRQYQNIPGEDKTPEVYVKLAMNLMMLGNPVDAYTELQAGLERYPDSAFLYFQAAGFAEHMSSMNEDEHVREEWLEISRDYTVKAIELEPSVIHYAAYAHVSLELGDYEKALKLYTLLIDQYDKDFYYGIRGMIYLELGKQKEGFADLEKAAQNGDVQALIRLSEAAVSSGNEKKAIEYLTKVYELRPDIVQSGLFLAEIYHGKGDYPLALKYYTAIEPYLEGEMRYDILSRIGILSIDTGDYESAMRAFEEILSVDESDSKVFYMAAAVAEMLNEPEAEKIYLRGIELFPDFSVLKKRLAIYYLGESEPQKAMSAMDGIDEVERDVDYYHILGEINFMMNNFEKAAVYFKEGLSENPGNLQLTFALATLYIDTGNIDGSIEALEAALEYEPDSSVLQNFLGYLYADYDMNLDDAEKLIDKALKKEPANWAYLDSKAWVLYKKGNYKKAYYYIKKAYELSDDIEIQGHYRAIEEKLK